LKEYFIGCIKITTFSWTIIQPAFCHDYFFIRDGGEITAFWKILSNLAIAIFIGASLPGSIGMCEADVSLKALGDPLKS